MAYKAVHFPPRKTWSSCQLLNLSLLRSSILVSFQYNPLHRTRMHLPWVILAASFFKIAVTVPVLNNGVFDEGTPTIKERAERPPYAYTPQPSLTPFDEGTPTIEERAKRPPYAYTPQPSLTPFEKGTPTIEDRAERPPYAYTPVCCLTPFDEGTEAGKQSFTAHTIKSTAKISSRGVLNPHKVTIV